MVLHVRKHGGLDEVAFVAHAVAARQELRLLLLTGVDVAHHLVELVLIHLRPLFGVLIEGIADGALLRARDALVYKLVVALLLDVQPRTSAAALPLVEEQRKVSTFDGFIHVRVGEHDVGAFSAQLQRNALQVGFRGRLHDQVAHFR